MNPDYKNTNGTPEIITSDSVSTNQHQSDLSAQPVQSDRTIVQVADTSKIQTLIVDATATKKKKRSIKLIISFTILLILTLATAYLYKIYVTPLNELLAEKIINDSSIIKALGQKPMFFKYLPDGLEVKRCEISLIDHNAITIFIEKPSESGYSEYFINIIEKKTGPTNLTINKSKQIDHNGTTYYSLGTSTRTMTMFQKNNLWITLVTNPTIYSESELYKIAESSY